MEAELDLAGRMEVLFKNPNHFSQSDYKFCQHRLMHWSQNLCMAVNGGLLFLGLCINIAQASTPACTDIAPQVIVRSNMIVIKHATVIMVSQRIQFRKPMPVRTHVKEQQSVGAIV